MKNFERIHTVEEAIIYINEIGFLPLFRNDIPGYSLEERTVPEDWFSGNPERDPWEWREIIAGSGQVAYGKFFDKKTGFGKGGVIQRRKSNRTEAKDWIIPANPKYYDVVGEFEVSNIVRWKQRVFQSNQIRAIP